MTINNFRDTIQALLDGKKIQREDWSEGEFIHLDKNGWLVDENSNGEYIEFTTDGCYKVCEEEKEAYKNNHQ